MFFCINNINGKKFRAVREDASTVFVFSPGKRKYGWRMSNDEFEDLYRICKTYHTDENKKWHKRIKKAIQCLESSGLWSNLLSYFQNLDIMSLEDKKNILSLYWKSRDYQSLEWDVWFQKYPFLKSCTNDTISLNTEYLFEMSDVKLETMYFGKYNNACYKTQIADALDAKKDICLRTRTNYDVSYEYQVNKNKAWYSKEYYNCANGQYYIALDSNIALFVEKD